MRKMSDYSNTNPETDSTQFGTFKNESEPSKSDGTDIKAEQMQDPYYALYQILQLAGELPNGELENGSNSKQFIKCLTSIGWFKYDSNIIYKKSSIVINTINNITKLYRSKKDNNKSSLSDINSWINILTINNDNTITLNTNSSENTGVFIGAFMYGIRNDTAEGWLRCDGSDYPASVFIGFITNYLLTGKIAYKTITDWNIEYNENNGNCGYFAYQQEIIERDEETGEPILDENGNSIIIQAGILRVPCFKDQLYITTALNSGNIGKFIEAGLPNITGTYQSACGEVSNVTGAFTGTRNVGGRGYWNGWDGQTYRVFDASKSNAIYGKSNTVTTDNISYPIFICISNTPVPVSEAQYKAFIDGLTNKVDTGGYSNLDIDFIIESFDDENGNWYRKYKSGLIEQGGVSLVGNTAVNINLFIPISSNLYSIIGSANENGNTKYSNESSLYFFNKTSFSFQSIIRGYNGVHSGTYNVFWEVRGYELDLQQQLH